MSLDDMQRAGVQTPRSKLPYVLAAGLALSIIAAGVWFLSFKQARDMAAAGNSAWTANATVAAPAPPAASRGELLPSGLRIETIREGNGALITRADAVLVRYEMRVVGGPVIDGNMDAPEGMGMSLNMVIPGFAEALTRMRPGGIARIQVPPSLGYGANMPPNAPFRASDTLEFLIRVERVAVGRGAELEAGTFPARPGNSAQAAPATPARR